MHLGDKTVLIRTEGSQLVALLCYVVVLNNLQSRFLIFYDSQLLATQYDFTSGKDSDDIKTIQQKNSEIFIVFCVRKYLQKRNSYKNRNSINYQNKIKILN